MNPPLLREVDLRVFDQYQREWPREYRPAPVRVVEIDDESLARIGQWPWPRSVMRDLVVRLGELGAGAIVMDIVFAEPDREGARTALWSETMRWVPSTLVVRARKQGI